MARPLLAQPALATRAVLRTFACLAGLLALLALTGCTAYTNYTVPNSEYDQLSPAERAEFRRSIRPCTDRSGLDESSPQFEAIRDLCTLSIIEFDDQGEFWKPKQLDETLDLIQQHSVRGEGSIRGADGEPGDEALVLIFVHGWKNDASPENEAEKNLGSFKKVLIQLAREEMRKSEAEHVQRRQVIGVYMAWSGLTTNNKLLKQLTFFGRKNAATRVARVSFSHAIHRIVAHTKGTYSNRVGNPDSLAIVVGHSFGGLIVENTLLRTLTVETNDFEAYGADLSVLVNPANEAILARQSIHALEGAPPAELKLGGERVSRPLIVSVTSVGDTATGNVFPLGLWIKGFFKKFRTYEDHEPGHERQKYYYTHTPGHIGEEGALYSHSLSCPREPNGVCQKVPDPGADYVAAMEERIRSMTEMSETLFPPPMVELGPCHREAEKRDGVECIERLSFLGAATGQLYTVTRDPSSPNQTGYWIMQLPVAVVADHSDIFQSELASMLAAFINLKRGEVVKDLDEAENELQKLYPDQ